MKTYKSVYLFCRDFRLTDNLGFLSCYKQSKEICLIFVFTPQQIKDNEYFSNTSFSFMCNCIEEMNKVLYEKYKTKIHVFYGETINILKQIKKDFNYNAIFFNEDYTPFAKARHNLIQEFCNKNDVEVFTEQDYLLKPMGTLCKADGTPFEVYTPFYHNALKHPIDKPVVSKFQADTFHNLKGHSADANKVWEKVSRFRKVIEDKNFIGGRTKALLILKNIQKFKNYSNQRNILSIPTTQLSAYIKFGCVSIREVYHAFLSHFGKDCTLISQLYWREFYYYLVYYFPKVLHGKSLKEKYDKVKWSNPKKNMDAWCEGRTGFPVVDAAMREMNETGFMHNRGRLIVSAVLIKILDVDWRFGEKIFAQRLIDYDPAVNNGNWQWASGSGADSSPYFRIFNPWKQAMDYDPDCTYIKKWIPELRDVPNKDIFRWGDVCHEYKIDYPCPIVSYTEEREKTLKKYKKALM